MDELDRLYRLLVDAIRAQQPELLTRPFEVADIYQSIMPYRLHRRALGMETNSDYEMTLLRLLSGERGYVIGDEEMQDALRRELATPNPDPGAFRPFAQSHVALAADALRRLEQGNFSAAPGRGMPTPAATPTVAPRVAAAAAAPLPPMPPVVPAAPAPMRSPVTNPSLQQTMSAPPRSTTAEALGGRCRYCSGALPAGRRLTFCPHCGQNLTVQHCPACNTELEVGWKFCTTCGRGVSAT
ncbi:MAG: zinc ribbon domain-containing protein [Gemmatimonadaceae bacterium]